jgi:hypothetical protein
MKKEGVSEEKKWQNSPVKIEICLICYLLLLNLESSTSSFLSSQRTLFVFVEQTLKNHLKG